MSNDGSNIWDSPCSDRNCVLRTVVHTGQATNGGCEHLKLRPREYAKIILSLIAERDDARRGAEQHAKLKEAILAERALDVILRWGDEHARQPVVQPMKGPYRLARQNTNRLLGYEEPEKEGNSDE